MLNKVILHGRIARDFTIDKTKIGKSVTKIVLAVSRDYRDKNGEVPCDFIPCILYDKNAEFVKKHFEKGDQLILIGRLQINKWTGKEGETRYYTEVSGTEVIFCGTNKRKKENDAGVDYDASFVGGFTEEDEEDGDLPF